MASSFLVSFTNILFEKTISFLDEHSKDYIIYPIQNKNEKYCYFCISVTSSSYNNYSFTVIVKNNNDLPEEQCTFNNTHILIKIKKVNTTTKSVTSIAQYPINMDRYMDSICIINEKNHNKLIRQNGCINLFNGKKNRSKLVRQNASIKLI